MLNPLQAPIDSAGLPSLSDMFPSDSIPDSTGGFRCPDTTVKRVRHKAQPKGGLPKYIRKGRRAVLRTPVLTVLLGRRLAKPTHSALELISKGIVIDVGDARGAAPVLVPVPVPVPAAPTGA